MKTVEIYIQEDFKDELIDDSVLNEVNKIKEELGLSCGNQISKKSQIPYLWLDEYTVSCFKILCPRVAKLKDYTGQIPLEALKHAKQSKQETHFDWIEIWSNRKDPDPFMIGHVYRSESDRANEYTWSTDKYLIARWGDEKKPIPQLVREAVDFAEKEVMNAALKLESKVVGIINYLKQNPRCAAEESIKNGNSSFRSDFDAKELLKKELDL